MDAAARLPLLALAILLALAPTSSVATTASTHTHTHRGVVRKEQQHRHHRDSPSVLLEVQAEKASVLQSRHRSDSFNGAIEAVAFSPSHNEVATGSADNATTIWDADSGHPLRTFYYHKAKVHHIVFSPDGEMILSGAKDGKAVIWNPHNMMVEREFEETGPIESAGFSRSGSYIITGSDNTFAKIWDTRNSKLKCTLRGHVKPVQAVAINPQGGSALTGSEDYTARIWAIDKCIAAAEGNGDLLHKLIGHTGTISSVAYSPYGRWVVTGSADFTARLWDHRTGKPIRVFGKEGGAHMGTVTAIVWKPMPLDAQKWEADHDQVLTGSHDGTAKLWKVHTGQLLWTFTHGGMVNSVAFSADGARIVTGSSDGTAKIWSIANGQAMLTVHGDQISPGAADAPPLL